jgi:hypothetical protein
MRAGDEWWDFFAATVLFRKSVGFDFPHSATA